MVRAFRRSSPSTASPAGTVLLSLVLWAVTACGGEDALGPPGPEDTLLLKSVKEQVRSDPGVIQIGTFVRDARNRIIRYEFQHNRFGPLRVTYYAEYDWEGARLAETRTYVVENGESFLDSTRRYGYDAQDRVVASTVEDASTGVTVTEEYRYDGQGRIAGRRVVGDSREVYEYDANGRLVRSLHYLDQEGEEPVSELLYTPAEGRNPFYGLPPRAGVILISPAARPLGRWLPRRVDVRVPETGANPSYTTVDADLNEEGFPVRRIDTLVNTADPANQTTVVESEYEYEQR